MSPGRSLHNLLAVWPITFGAAWLSLASVFRDGLDRVSSWRYILRMRPILETSKVAPGVQTAVAEFHKPIVDEVKASVAKDRIVVVGMAQNPFVKKARKLLAADGIQHTYLEYGSYFSKWKERLAIKLWAGFPTFPMVFVDGVLQGGHDELVVLKEKGLLTP